MSITLSQLFLLAGGALMLTGIYGVISRNNMVRILLSVNILQTGVNLLLTAVGYVENGTAALITPTHTQVQNMVDPLPQALVLTSIVIGFGTTALALVLILRHFATHKDLKFYAPLKENLKETEQ